MYKMSVRTQEHGEFLEITEKVGKIVSESGVVSGYCIIYIPHTTAGITINENADPDVRQDMLAALDKVIPWEGDYRHLEGNSAAHVKAAMMGHSCTVFIEEGRMVLGTWQGIFFCEFDGPRHRKVFVRIIGDASGKG